MATGKHTDSMPSLISHLDPRSPISEMYQMIRTNLSFAQIDAAIQVVVVTSATQGEGKSVTASNLAITSGQAGTKTLLVDTDLRLPILHRRLGLSNMSGLTTALLQPDRLHSCIQTTVVPNLDVLTSGPTPPNPAEVLNSNAMKNLLQVLRGEYDLIILDSPPLLPLSDAHILSRTADGVILVIGAGIVKRVAVQKAKEHLRNAQAKVLGVVINGVKNHKLDRYMYRYVKNK